MAPKPILEFLRDQWAQLPDTAHDLTGKSVIVVGANVGLGFEASKKLATMNPAKLILACRNQVKGDEAVAKIKKDTGTAVAECWTVDLANFKSISAFVDRFEKEGGGRLDILLENAGLSTRKFESTDDGWETTVQVNHLGTALLALLLLPVMASTPGSPRITIVSSEVHYFVKRLEEADESHVLNTLNDEKSAKMGQRYHVSKLLNVFFVRSLAKRMKPVVPVAVNAVNPGLCDTSLRRNVPFPLSAIFELFILLIARTAEYGSRTLTHAALWGTKEELHGKYLNKCFVEEESDYSISKEGREVEERVWNETIDILKEADPRVTKIVDEYLTT